MKKRSPKDIIEEKNPKVEHAYVKFPGQEMECIDLTYEQGPDLCNKDLTKLKRLWEKYEKQRYTEIHTHHNIIIPSGHDLKHFLIDDDKKCMVIAQQNRYNGKVAGYLVLRKTEKTEKIGIYSLDKEEKGSLLKIHNPKIGVIYNDTRRYDDYWEQVDKIGMDVCMEHFYNIIKKNHLQIKYVPTEGYKVLHGLRFYPGVGKKKK